MVRDFMHLMGAYLKGVCISAWCQYFPSGTNTSIKVLIQTKSEEIQYVADRLSIFSSVLSSSAQTTLTVSAGEPVHISARWIEKMLFCPNKGPKRMMK
jgi:hypothetical protein